MIRITSTGPAKVAGTDFLDSRRLFRSPTSGMSLFPAYDLDPVSCLEPARSCLTRADFLHPLRVMISRCHLEKRRAPLFRVNAYQVPKPEQILPDPPERIPVFGHRDQPAPILQEPDGELHGTHP